MPHQYSDHAGREEANRDLEVMIHAENEKGLRRIIINFTPSYVQYLPPFMNPQR